MNQSDFEAQALAGGYATAVAVTQPAGYDRGLHDHPFDAFALIVAGQIDIGVAGVVSSYKVGDVFRLARDTLHTESAVEQGVTYLAARRLA